MEQTNKVSQRSNAINYHIAAYTREQKIVAAVWYHERHFTGLSVEQLQQNFLVRFKTEYPKYRSINRWQQQLFKNGFLAESSRNPKPRTTLARLIHVPYVKESLVRFPDLTLRARANLLGIPHNTLNSIFKNDLKESDLVNIKKSGQKDDVEESTVLSESEIKIEDEELEVTPDLHVENIK